MTERGGEGARPRAARPRRAHLDGAEALVLAAISLLLLFTVGGWMAARLGIAGLAAAEGAVVLAPTVAWLSLREVSLGEGLGLAAPGGRALLGGVLAGAGGFYLVAALVEAAQERLLPMPPALKEELRRRIVPVDGLRPLAVDLATLALVPALCEEALFRGAVQRAFGGAGRGREMGGEGRRGGEGAAVAVLGTALLFGLYHRLPQLVAPTATLGIVLGALAFRAGSLWPAVVAHATHNTLVILMVRAGYDDPPAAWSPFGALLLATSIAALGGGLALAGRGTEGKSSGREVTQK